MRFARFLEVAWLDLCFHLRRPLFWILLLILALLAWGLSTGNMRIESGDSEIGGKKAFITSAFAQAQVHTILVLLVHGFFVAVAFGLAILRDEEQKIGELLHATPLTIGEYVWGKFTALLAVFGGALVFQALASAVCNHLFTSAKSAEFVGPFSLASYLVPVVVFSLPAVVFLGGTSLLVGTWSKRPVLVFLLPTALLLLCIFFLWDFSPTWLPEGVNTLLMLVDPAGARWLNETWLQSDKGVEFYNTQPVGLDAAFVLSRVAFLGLGLASVLAVQVVLARTLRATAKVTAKEGRDRAPAERRELPPLHPELSSPPSLLAGILQVARAELVELKSQPGLYIFVPLILVEVVGNFLFETGAFDTPLLVTPGMAAAGSMNTLTLCVCLLLTFYATESLERERARGLAAIFYATPVRSASILFGKSVANCAVAGLIVLAALLGCWIVVLVQGQVAFSLFPFLVTWGGLLVPTFVVWSTFVTFLYALTRNRYGTYGLALGALIFTGWMQARGHMNWAGNWNLWGSVRWSDLALYELIGSELLLNRAAYLALAVFFVALSVRLFPRRGLDAATLVERLKPRALFLGTLRLAPFWIAPLVLIGWLNQRVNAGFQGATVEKLTKDYWRKNIQTWKDAPKPSITALELDLSLDPPRSWLHSKGVLTLVNDRPEPIARFAVTRGLTWRDVKWTLDGEAFGPEDRTGSMLPAANEPHAPGRFLAPGLEDRAGLMIVTPKEPLAPGRFLTLGFDFESVFPDGATENGGNASEFVLPSGAVLTSFTPSFVPMIGFQDGVGVDEDNRSDPKQWPADHYAGVTQSAFGNNTPCTTRITITLPEEYTANSVGELVGDEVRDGQRTVTWKTDYPVDFANVVAGKWAVKRGTGTAIYYHPGHAHNVDEMLLALDGARKWFSEWFAPFPWKELKLSEFAGHAGYAQGFPTNITFSENLGFLTQSKPDAQAPFMVTAHEAAHQWWGNLLTPGEGPGGQILSEGMAHFATALLMEQVQGERERIAFLTKIEDTYGESRQVDSEKPLVLITGERPGDTTCTYDKGGWTAWMLLNHMGRDRMLAGCRELIARYSKGPDHPVIEDYLAVLREQAQDQLAFDAFTRQWYLEIVVPRYTIDDAVKARVAVDGATAPALDDAPATSDSGSSAWDVEVTLTNRGTGTMPVEIAATRGERWGDDEAEHKAPSDATTRVEARVLAAGEEAASADEEAPSADEAYREARASTTLGAGESATVRMRCAFDPERIVVDPDAKVLMLDRKKAVRKL